MAVKHRKKWLYALLALMVICGVGQLYGIYFVQKDTDLPSQIVAWIAFVNPVIFFFAFRQKEKKNDM